MFASHAFSPFIKARDLELKKHGRLSSVSRKCPRASGCSTSVCNVNLILADLALHAIRIAETIIVVGLSDVTLNVLRISPLALPKC